VRGEFFLARDLPIDALVITEGRLLIVHADEISRLWNRHTLDTVVAVSAFRSIIG
jgi:8-oxo-dGTP diphosphatase